MTTKILTLDLPLEWNETLKYVTQVTGNPRKVDGLDIFERGLAALQEDAEWLDRVRAHEQARAASLARFGFAPTEEAPRAEERDDDDEAAYHEGQSMDFHATK